MKNKDNWLKAQTDLICNGGYIIMSCILYNFKGQGLLVEDQNMVNDDTMELQTRLLNNELLSSIVKTPNQL